jgi:hypothetical protein
LRINAKNAVHGGDVFFNTTTLANLMEQCQSLQALTLEEIVLDEDHIRVLGAYSRPGLEIELKNYRIVGAAATVLVNVLGRNQGPTKLDGCWIDNSVLVDGLRGNSRLKSLVSPPLIVDVAIAGALRENLGFVALHIRHFRMSDETWYAVCDSLKTHPTLQVLYLFPQFPDATMALAELNFQIQALVDMMKVNASIHTIHLDFQYTEHELFQRSVLPYLVTNRLRPRLLAIQKTRPMAYRAKLLGRALLSARTDVNSFWMLLSGNAEVAFPPKATTTTLVANLPTPATIGASADANGADAASGVASITASTTAASIVPAPAAGQKRKACARELPNRGFSE